MKVRFYACLISCILCLPGISAAQAPGITSENLILSNLATSESFQDAVFEWNGLPGWIFTDVVFGVRKGDLFFAKFTAIPPNGTPRFHDKSAEADYLIDNTRELPELVGIDLGNGRKALIESFTIGVLPNGRAVIDSARGYDSEGQEITVSAIAAGSCGSPRVIGNCTDVCSGNCFGNVQTGDPCVCNGFGGCTSGSARWNCPVGSCTTACDFQATIGCVCLP